MSAVPNTDDPFAVIEVAAARQVATEQATLALTAARGRSCAGGAKWRHHGRPKKPTPEEPAMTRYPLPAALRAGASLTPA